MKILVTSGGTKVPIDRVRSITNMSQGTFGSRIALEFLRRGHEVVFLRAIGSKSPFSITVDLAAGRPARPERAVRALKAEFAKHKGRYREVAYSTFSEYAEQLAALITGAEPDAVVLAAAVSDYGVKNYVHGKVRSRKSMTIKLKPLPKLISRVKPLNPAVKLVGFKLLVDSELPELVEAAQSSVRKNRCDMVVANDLRDIKANAHRIHLVFPGGRTLSYESAQGDPNALARRVVKHTEGL